MSRTGLEPKPPWRAVPRPMRDAVEAQLGAPVARAARIWGGYGPTPTYRLRLGDGRRAFFKGASPDDNDFIRRALAREERFYHEVGDLIAPWVPRRLGRVERDGWSALLLEDLGPKSAPPWTPGLARAVAHGLAAFHQATLGAELPDFLPRFDAGPPSPRWRWGFADDPAWVAMVAGLAGRRAAEASAWLAAAVPPLREAALAVHTLEPRRALLHRDVRSDNLRVLGGRLVLVDWPHAGVGSPEYDVVEFAQTVAVEGGPEIDAVVGLYAERQPVRAPALDGAAAALAGFFADYAPREDLPGLPRLRPFQRRQLKVTLAWAAHRLALPEPGWLEAVAD